MCAHKRQETEKCNDEKYTYLCEAIRFFYNM